MTQVARSERQRTIAERPTRFINALQSVRSDDAIDIQAARLLKCAHGLVHAIIKEIRFRTLNWKTNECQLGSDLADGDITVASSKQASHARSLYRYAARSASRAVFGFAPMICFTT